MSDVLDKISVHLEFLGYRVEKDENDGNPFLMARHDNRYSAFLIEMPGGIILIQASATVPAKLSSAMIEFINKANQKLFSKLTLEVNDEQITYIRFSVIYTGEYNKAVFSNLIESFQNDQKLLCAIDDYNKVFGL